MKYHHIKDLLTNVYVSILLPRINFNILLKPKRLSHTKRKKSPPMTIVPHEADPLWWDFGWTKLGHMLMSRCNNLMCFPF